MAPGASGERAPAHAVLDPTMATSAEHTKCVRRPFARDWGARATPLPVEALVGLLLRNTSGTSENAKVGQMYLLRDVASIQRHPFMTRRRRRRARRGACYPDFAMCRYAFRGPYRDHYACFTCRKSFKWPHDRTVDPRTLPAPVCPDCHSPLEAMGLDFRAPPKDDLRQWRKVQILALRGIRYLSCGCGPGPRPEELREVAAFLAHQLPTSEGERLLQRIDAAVRAHGEATRSQ